MLVLVGLPGSGKSSVGKALARRMQVEAVDSDLVIEAQLGCSIREFFEREGEAAFRDVEQAVLAQLCAAQPGVLSTGGGAVLREANRQQLQARGTVVYLHALPEMLARRLRHDTKRPLLEGPAPLKKLKSLYAERDPLYRACAHFVLETQRSTPAMLASRILMQLELQAP